jgi:uncharacterized protein (DUF342 family)
VRDATGFQVIREQDIDGWRCAVKVDPEQPLAQLVIDKQSHAIDPCPVEKIADWAAESGLTLSENDTTRLPAQIRSVSASPTGASVVIVRGVPAVTGHPGQIVWKVAVPGADRLALAESIKIDHREVDLFYKVSLGVLLCEISKPHMGMAGRDVYGEPIPPSPPPPPLPVELGEGVEFLSEPRRVLSAAEGCVDYDGKTLSVVQIYRVPGDVDFNVGNIDFEGNVMVAGNVIEGFKVVATGDVEIAGVVDAAHVVAGGSIKIGGGVTGHGRSVLRAGMDIKAHYLNGANVQAGRNVHIDRQVRGCTIACGGSLIVDRGGIVGGRTRAAGFVRTSGLGSEMYISTYVAAGVGLMKASEFGKMHSPMAKLRETIYTLERAIAPLLKDPEAVKNLSKPERVKFKRRRATLCDARTELEKMETAVVETGGSAGTDPDATITVMRDIYPNCQVQIGNESIKKFDEHMKGEHKIMFDPDLNHLVAKRS